MLSREPPLTLTLSPPSRGEGTERALFHTGSGSRAKFGAIAAFLLLLTLPLHAALTTSALTGQVTVTNARADGVTVTALSRATQLVRTTMTNGRGRYFLGALAPGEYDVTFARKGLSSVTRPATVELGRVARADATLEPNDDEESVMSTAITVSVADTTPITTHFAADELERVPLRRDLDTALTLSPVLPSLPAIVDDTAMFFPTLLGEEALDEVTVVRGAQPIELAGGVTGVILARIRSGSDTLFLSVRDTYSTHDGGGHVLESASGGRIVPQRLWFFASGWGGDATDAGMYRLRGLTLKLDAQAAAAHHFTATYTDADTRFSRDRVFPGIGTTAASVRYTGILDERLTAEALVSRAEAGDAFLPLRDDALAAKISYRTGDHVISAGGQRSKHPNSDVDALYLGDRWTFDRWTVDAGLRRDGDRTLTRAAAAFDLRSSTGSHAIVASWGEYLTDNPSPGFTRQPALRIASIGYTSSLESSGAARIDLLHYAGAGTTMDQVQLDARYRLFDRFLAGASYVYSRIDPRPFFLPEHLATVVLGLQLPIGGRELGATVLERYDARTWTTGIGVRYEIPIRRVSLTLAGDATNVFDSAESGPFITPEGRGLRFWARVRR
jgi:Carboxypeptidase regulatory-like domain